MEPMRMSGDMPTAEERVLLSWGETAPPDRIDLTPPTFQLVDQRFRRGRATDEP